MVIELQGSRTVLVLDDSRRKFIGPGLGLEHSGIVYQEISTMDLCCQN